MNANILNVSTYDLKNSLRSNGYEFQKVMQSTLQGQIIKVKRTENNSDLVIKIANKKLFNKRITIVDNKEIHIEENILSEKDILQFLTTSNNPSPYMTNYIDYFDDAEHHFLVMEHGGMGLFHFAHQFHNYISNGCFSIVRWQHICKLLFKQMVMFIDWLHNIMDVCHLDISLENLLISGVNISFDKKTNQINIVENDLQIRFCDFGLAESFIDSNKNFECAKYVGKRTYKSPKIYERKETFDARLADVWSLGVVFFILSTGNTPFKKPSKDDNAFNFIMKGWLHKILIHLKKTLYVTPDLYRLLYNIFKTEEERITIKEILEQPYFD
eukprot:457106_1